VLVIVTLDAKRLHITQPFSSLGLVVEMMHVIGHIFASGTLAEREHHHGQTELLPMRA
jgi:hypothetical protein